MFKKIELAANLAIIVIAILLGVILVRNYMLPRSESQPGATQSTIMPGTKLSMAGVDWKANGKTLVLALSTGCHFCTESAPFYQRIAQEKSKAGNTRIVAAFPQPIAEGQKYLSDLSVKVDAVTQTSLDSVGVRGTPTLILADENGLVIDSWRGKLPSEKESEVLNRLK